MSESKVVIDSNVIASLYVPPTNDGLIERQDEVSRVLRRCLLLYTELLVPDVVLDELRGLRNIEIPVEEIMDLYGLSPISIPRVTADASQTEKGVYRLPRVSAVDASLISFVATQQTDIYTYDRHLLMAISENACVDEASFSLWFPIDDETLKRMSLKDLRSHGELFRATYAAFFERIRQLDAQIATGECDLGDLLREKESRVAELQDRLKHKDEYISDLKHLAQPNLGFTIFFSALDLATGLLPFPVTTAPLSHVIAATKYRKIVGKHEG